MCRSQEPVTWTPLPRFYHTAGCQRGRSGPTVNRLHPTPRRFESCNSPLHTTPHGWFLRPERAPSTTKENHHARHAALAPISRNNLRLIDSGADEGGSGAPATGDPADTGEASTGRSSSRSSAPTRANGSSAPRTTARPPRNCNSSRTRSCPKPRRPPNASRNSSAQRRLRGGETTKRVEGAGLQGDRSASLAATATRSRP